MPQPTEVAQCVLIGAVDDRQAGIAECASERAAVVAAMVPYCPVQLAVRAHEG